MNNEEAQYRFRRTVAEVIKALTEPEEPIAPADTEKFDITDDTGAGEPDHGQ